MKVKELITKLQEFNPDKEVCYECLYIDYVHDNGTHIDLGGTHLGLYPETDDEAINYYKPESEL